MGAVEVTLIRAGASANGNVYGGEVLRGSMPLWEGATAFVDHPSAIDGTRAGGRSVRDIAGVYRGARWQEGVGIRATLHFAPGAEWLRRLVEAALADRAAGRAVPKIGVSADMLVLKRPARDEAGRRVWEVTRIERVNSVDVVFDPSAGGSFDRIVEAEWIEGGPAREARLVELAGLGDARLVPAEAVRESAADPVGSRDVIEAPRRLCASAADPVATDQAVVMETLVVEGRGMDGQVLEGPRRDGQVSAGPSVNGQGAAGAGDGELRRALCRDLLEARLARLGLPEAASAAVRRRLDGRAFEARELDAEIEEVRGLIAEGASAGAVRGHGAERSTGTAGGQVSGMRTPLERLQCALDRLFGVALSDALADTPRLRGIREAYTLLTGDGQGTGCLGGWGDEPWSGGAGALVREANETTTATLPNVLRNSMTKRLVADYQAQTRWWEPAVSSVGISDLKTQDRIRLNDFGALATVTENAAYANVAWGDARETYTPAKRGNTVAVTLEAILNDDTHAITRIPAKLATAAAVTINEFVANLFTSNPTMADSSTVYDAGGQTTHGNAATSALSASALQTAIAAMMKQTNSAGKRIGVRPRFLLVPPDLLFSALALVNSTLAPGTNNNDVNVLQGLLQVIAVPQFTDATDWYLQAAPNELEGIEIGFLNGQREPELLVQDQPNAGTVFTNDAITYKVRWIFGGGWVDYRGAYRAIVAG